VHAAKINAATTAVCRECASPEYWNSIFVGDVW
jgi:hypothetical protein